VPELSNLPRLFELVAASLGTPVATGEDTIGGCSLWAHAPSTLAASCGAAGRMCSKEEGAALKDSDGCTCKHVDEGEFPRTAGAAAGAEAVEGCTMTNVHPFKPSYHPCPQQLTRPNEAGSGAPAWDFVVGQVPPAGNYFEVAS
jgi:hypothetical protein